MIVNIPSGIVSRPNICFSKRSSCPLAFSGDCNSKAIYSKIPLKSLSACSDTSTSYIISHNPCENQQKLFSHFLSVQPAYPFSNSSRQGIDGAAPCLLTAIADALDAVSIASLIVFPFKIPAIKYPV